MKKAKSSSRQASQPAIRPSNSTNVAEQVVGQDQFHAWDAFWFQPTANNPVHWLRRIVCLLTALWFLPILVDVEPWWGKAGLQEAAFNRKLAVATEDIWPSRFRITPLWMTSEARFIQVWSAAGIALATASAAGIGGRLTLVALMLAVLFLAQRMTWSTGACEPYLIALLGYLALAQPSTNQPSTQPHWRSQLAWRMIQIHTWLLLAAALASQLANPAWWQGESVWWLAVTDHSTVLSSQWLVGKILLINLLTHTITICTLGAVIGLWPLNTSAPRAWSMGRRKLGLGCGLVVACSYALVGDQFLYGMLLVATCWANATDELDTNRLGKELHSPG
ncbi:MAG: hypothetical protein IT423_24750 [Pirellulaceae bacterium]|nr:hypothetical protein [Pirellulaceae bacterium]